MQSVGRSEFQSKAAKLEHSFRDNAQYIAV